MNNVAATVIELAKKHMHNGAAMQSSAVLCVGEAECLLVDGHHDYAARRALISLSYSVGILHADHVAAKDMIKTAYGY